MDAGVQCAARITRSANRKLRNRLATSRSWRGRARSAALCRVCGRCCMLDCQQVLAPEAMWPATFVLDYT